jgi:hypothetical protein
MDPKNGTTPEDVTSLMTWKAPRVVDGGAVVSLTQDGSVGEKPEVYDITLIWDAYQ